MEQRYIPVVDLFAGPGGLGEGFSAMKDEHGEPVFKIKLSVEKDPVAHQTLTLRALYRALAEDDVPDSYYQYISGKITKEKFLAEPSIAPVYAKVKGEARCMELGNDPNREIDKLIRNAIDGKPDWVLIGGPPCQAYSLAGRARRRNVDPDFESDPKHFLYREYLRVIREFRPSVFVMENVKGMLSSTHGGERIFQQIIDDLSEPTPGVFYDIRSFVIPCGAAALEPKDFTIQSEMYGVPQTRHRVILLGICADRAGQTHDTLKKEKDFVTVHDVLADLPSIRSKLSVRSMGKGQPDTEVAWRKVVGDAVNCLDGMEFSVRTRLEPVMLAALENTQFHFGAGGTFIPGNKPLSPKLPTSLSTWLFDERLKGVIQHEARSHMASDLQRYLFAACYGAVYKCSLKLCQFPPELLPAHKNATDEAKPFEDRFRVQLYSGPSTTVVSHIAKDGHYYIHPDHTQCRSLTVREAARLQTFPDNYFFEGNRTQQYHQVGNAVPPFLAKQLAESVASFFKKPKKSATCSFKLDLFATA